MTFKSFAREKSCFLLATPKIFFLVFLIFVEALLTRRILMNFDLGHFFLGLSSLCERRGGRESGLEWGKGWKGVTHNLHCSV
jgi:hypothetical protein